MCIYSKDRCHKKSPPPNVDETQCEKYWQAAGNAMKAQSPESQSDFKNKAVQIHVEKSHGVVKDWVICYKKEIFKEG